MKKFLFILGILFLGLAVFIGWSVRTRLIAQNQPHVPPREEVSVTVIEGWTVRDIMDALQAKGIDVRPSDFLAARFADDFPFLKTLPPETNLEGYLVPDTYRVWKDELPDGLIKKQLSLFPVTTTRDQLILASIVEKEAKYEADRPIIAGIFMNRLKIGMALQSDATLNYVLRSGQARLTAKDLETNSPYNTYANRGLPPGPICNPGRSSLEAAIHPTKTSYFYFLTDSQGKAYYAKTLEEHVRNRLKAFGS